MESGWIQMVEAIPRVLLYGLGEFALWLVIACVLLALVSWVTNLLAVRPARMPSAVPFLVFGLVAAVPAAIYLLARPDAGDGFGQQRVTSHQLLMPPIGTEWPAQSGYLDVPQLAQGGQGVIRIGAPALRVYVKLCEAGRSACPGLRRAYLLPGDTFEMRELPAGTYEVRYLPIDSPGLGGRSGPLEIGGEAPSPVSLQLTNSLSLHSRTDPIMGISPEEF